MLKHMKTAALAALGGVALGATLFGGIPALAAGNGAGFGQDSLRAELGQAQDTSACSAANGSAGTCTMFTDSNGDGICDTCGSAANRGRHVCANFVDEDGNGVCDACATGADCPNGAGYVDADGDSVCDNYGTGAVGGHHGHHARGHHGGRGRC